MDATAELAGFFAAHAVWCVSDGETLIPMLAFEKSDGTRQMNHLVTDDHRRAVELGQDWLKRNPESAARAVLIYDGFITLETGKTDALLVEAHLFEPHHRSVIIALPYRHAEHPAGFAVHRPKYLEYEGDEPDFVEITKAFFIGVNQHEEGAKVWNEHLDQSL